MDDIIKQMAAAISADLYAFNFRKPWKDMDEPDRGRFITLMQLLLRHLGKTVAFKEGSPYAYPLLVMALRRHGRSFENVYAEYKIDPAEFVEETLRMQADWEANMKAYADEIGNEWNERSEPDKDRESFAYLFQRLFEVYEKHKAEGRR